MSYLLVGKKVEKKPSIYIFLSSFRKTCSCFKRGNRLAFLYAFLFFITSNVILIVGIFTKTRIPSYVVSSIADLPMIRWGITAVFCVLYFISFQNLFTLAYFLLEGKSLKESKKSNLALRKGNVKNALFNLVLCNVSVIICSIVIYYIVILFEALFVILFVSRTRAVATFLTLIEHAKLYVSIFIGWFGMYCNLGMLVELFLKYKKENDEQYRTDDIRITARFFTDRNKKIILCVTIGILFICDGFYTYENVVKGGISVLAGFEGTKITAHRGSSYEAPENSIPAIQKAIENLADYAEIDVQQTKDGQIILMHDSNLLRTAGVNEFVWNLTYDELKEFDIGSWFSKEYEGTTIPTLNEVMELCKGKIKLNIEVKSNNKTPELEQKVAKLIEEYDFERQCVVQSVSYVSLKRIKEYNSNIQTGYILMAAIGNLEDKKFADFFNVKSTFVNSQLVESAHKNGKEVHAWTVNTKNELRRMKVLKVDNIITDRPILAREVIYEEKFNNSLTNLLKLIKM